MKYVYTNSIQKRDQVATEGCVEASSLQAAQDNRRSNDELRSKWIWHYTTMNSPIGPLKLVANDQGLASVSWNFDPLDVSGPWHEARNKPSNPLLVNAIQQLIEYFEGRRHVFSLPLSIEGTHFQQKVWSALCTIPYGQTRSYGEIARQIGNVGAARAVGAANRRNPVPIIVPCHRVIGASGDLIGFAGGLDRKIKLLTLERQLNETFQKGQSKFDRP